VSFRATLLLVPVVLAAAQEFPPISDDDLREARELLPPPELKLPAETFHLDYNYSHRKLWETVAALLGQEVLFDSDYPETPANVRFRAAGEPARQVLQALSVATGSFIVPLTPKRFLVVKDTQQKRQEREPVVAVVLTLPDPVSIQEMQETARTVQQIMEIQKFGVDNGRRMVLLRDRVSKVRPSQHLFEQLLGAKPAVVIEMELFEVRGNGSTRLGVGVPTSSSVTWLSNLFRNGSGKAKGDLYTFGSGDSLFGITMGDATGTAVALRSFGKSLQRTFVQSINGQPAQLLLGEKYPILTAGYFGDTGGGQGDVFRPPPSFQFENLGLSLKVTPFVHDVDDMTLDVEAEFKLLTGAAINGIPILANRKFASRVRLSNEQWAVVGGLAQDTSTTTRSLFPGLSNNTEVDNTSMLLLMKPRLLSLPMSSTVKQQIFLGAETRPLMPF